MVPLEVALEVARGVGVRAPSLVVPFVVPNACYLIFSASEALGNELNYDFSCGDRAAAGLEVPNSVPSGSEVRQENASDAPVGGPHNSTNFSPLCLAVTGGRSHNGTEYSPLCLAVTGGQAA